MKKGKEKGTAEREAFTDAVENEKTRRIGRGQ